MTKGCSFLFKKSDLIPAIVQDNNTSEVLMLAYMNEESFTKTIEDGKCTFYSRSRQKLWQKGESSGHIMFVEEIYYDCDCDTLLIKVTPNGPACHTNNNTCFFRKFNPSAENDDTVM